MSHSNSVKNTTEVTLDTATMASPIGDEQNVPSHSSHLIPKYKNLRFSVLRQSKIFREKGKKGNGIPNVFGLIALFTAVAMSATKYILPETASFSVKLIHHEERAKDSPDILPNFTNPNA